MSIRDHTEEAIGSIPDDKIVASKNKGACYYDNKSVINDEC